MQFRLAHLPSVLLFLVFSRVQAANFTFSFGSPTQCDNFPISWSGGTPPFQLVLSPEFGTPRTVSIPSSSFSNGRGSFQTQIPFATKKNFIASMSDASGWGSGGNSPVLQVGPSVSNANCNTTDPGVDFFFHLDTALQQCRPYTFSNYGGAVQPITILGVIPGGESFILNPPSGPASFDWIADVAAGTSIMFTMSDSQGRKGGSSDVKQVGASDDVTCLNANSPVSVSNAPSATSSSTSPTASSSSGVSSPETGGTTSKSNTGAIVGGILAGLFAIVAIVVLVIFLIRRRRKSSSYGRGVNFPYGSSRRSRRVESVDLDPPSNMGDGHSPVPVIHPYPYTAPGTVPSAPRTGTFTHNLSPSAHDLLSQHPQDAHYDTQTQFSSLSNPYSPSANSQHSRFPSAAGSGRLSLTTASQTGEGGAMSTVSSAARRKAAMAGMSSYNVPTRFIVHQDLEEAQPPDEGDIVELPPQYSERRAPIPGLSDVPSPSYVTPPPGLSPHNPLEHMDQGEVGTQLQKPIEPGTSSPTSPQFPHS